MRSWTWMTVSGRTSMWPPEHSRCSSGNSLSLSLHMDPSMTLSTPSVSSCIVGPLFAARGYPALVYVSNLCPSLCSRMFWLQTASELSQRPDQEAAKIQPRHNAGPLQTPVQVKNRHAQHHLLLLNCVFNIVSAAAVWEALTNWTGTPHRLKSKSSFSCHYVNPHWSTVSLNPSLNLIVTF